MPNGLAPDVSEDVIADDQGRRYPEPDQAFQDIVDDEMTNEVYVSHSSGKAGR